MRASSGGLDCAWALEPEPKMCRAVALPLIGVDACLLLSMPFSGWTSAAEGDDDGD